ncbi:UDP-glycosyltransferase 87A1-like [Gastrolobium bilobum]|uniref:UDP-glycosyltransferase 87A1-like n=1 Tax=Gastrolobium bilobum TaxID=150636 RepID=UPI002AAFF50B|nr:UDP-glycosyltransferase 87A1-like [Gastrolobium bilobum]
MEAPLTFACHVVAMPYPARGHINPMMNLCKLMVSKNSSILVTFVVTEEWLGFIGSDPKPDNIWLSSIPNVVPSELIRGHDHPGFMEAVMTKMEAPFEQLLDHLQMPPTIILYDTFLYWVVVVGNRRNIPVASFWTMSASIFSVLLHRHLLEQNGHYPVNLSENGDKRVNYIPGISPMRLADFPLNDGSYRCTRLLQYSMKGITWVHKAQYLLFTSIYELEPRAIDVLKAELSLPVYIIGPAIPYFSLEGNNPILLSTNGTSHNYFEWLDAQPIASVLYISQGSFFSVSSSQIYEIAAALRESKVRFLWVARSEASRLKEICGNMGLVLEWCEQLRVLSHPAIGGFWSHCGWNSTKEGVLAGVPFLTFPIIMDQPLDSKMIVEDWKVGWRVKEDVNRNTLVSKDQIASLLQKFMDLNGDLSREMRERTKKLQQLCHHAMAHGGSAATDFNAFISDIMN